jgi:amidase
VPLSVLGFETIERNVMREREFDPKEASTLTRRGFIELGLGATVLAVACSQDAGLGEGSTASPSSPATFELDEMTISDLQDAMASGRLTSRGITEMYLSRIESIDGQGPTLRSILETNPEALDIAASLDDERTSGNLRGPLHGVPIILKDNIDTSDKMTTTAGSYALEGSIPAQDATVAAKLRHAGAVLLAKANLSEWANMRSTTSTSGWSGRGGQCRNPYALNRNPCGSSSGSGVAVSANLAAVAIGTETDGSVVCPANASGIVGIKPTIGLVSRAGIIPISHTQDTAGPMARTVRDAALVLGAIAGADPRDEATAVGASHMEEDYVQFLDPAGLRGARIGVVRKAFGDQSKLDAVIEDALVALREQGAELVDPAEFGTWDEFDKAELEVLLYEFKAGINKYLAGLGAAAPNKTLAELIEFNERNRNREMPYFGQEIFIQAQEKGPLTSPEYLEALESCRRLSRKEGIDAVMDRHNLDALVAPTGGPAWVTDLVHGDHSYAGSSSAAAVAGYPNITVPAGHVHGLPVGLSFFGRAWSEPRLLELAYAFEQATTWRHPPEFKPQAIDY